MAIMFCSAMPALTSLAGMEVLEDVQAGGAAQVGVEGHDLRVLGGQVGQGVAHLVAHLRGRRAGRAG